LPETGGSISRTSENGGAGPDAWALVAESDNRVLKESYNKIPFLRGLHRVHDSDAEMHRSWAVRFHTGEIVFSAIGWLTAYCGRRGALKTVQGAVWLMKPGL